MDNIVVFTVGFFLTPQYHVHYIPVTTISRTEKKNNNVNHYNGSNNNNKQKTKIRNFNRNSKVNFF
jgi:hypothetical protein